MNVVTGDEMRQIDRYTIEEIGLTEVVLMENAGQAFVQTILPKIEKTKRIVVLVGAGNNGGDGFVISRSLLDKGYHVDIWLIPPLEKVKGTARDHMNILLNCGYKIFSYQSYTHQAFCEMLKGYDYIIDALIGTGIKGTLRSPYREIIKHVNSCKCPVISVDLPSGLGVKVVEEDKDEIVNATFTITFQCPKTSAYLFPSRNYYGELMIVDVGIPQKAIRQLNSQCFLWLEHDLKRTLPVRKPSSHKGNHGKGLVIAGSELMTGAPILTTKACHRTGAGLVTLAIPDIIHKIVACHLVESTFCICPSKDGEIDMLPINMDKLNQHFDAIAIGPGIGRRHNTEWLKDILVQFKKPVVIDADGLFDVKQYFNYLVERKAPTILTPHPGEFAFLTGKSVFEIEQHRFELSKAFSVKYGVYLVLKGPYTIVTTPSGEQFVNTTGNAALAKGGSGDVLTGMILALIMQQDELQPAISNAVFLHGTAADYLVSNEASCLSVLASDVTETIATVLKQI